MPHSAGIPPARYGRYEILSRLATGGMGEVYLARAVGVAGFQKHVVIKKILPHLVEQKHFVDALVREAKLLVLLDHANIVQVLDLGEENGDYFMAMEFVNGYNLATIAHYAAQKQLQIPAAVCAAIGLAVLAGLEYAHELTTSDGQRQNVIHRDVSPQNVLISRDGRVKLTDFGIAKVLSEAEGELTKTLKGKFRYMAPEALDGHKIDRRYDLYAVGILLFEALCRRHLFGGRSDVEILRHVRAGKVPSIAQYHPGVSPALVRVVEKALSKDPAGRYSRAVDFAKDLREAIQPIDEAEAAVQLKAFVGELYERSDFPINKPKVPQLVNAQIETTRSVLLHSRVTEDPPPAARVPARQPVQATVRSDTKAIPLLALGLVILGAAVAYLAFQRPPYPVSGLPPRPLGPSSVIMVARTDGGSENGAGSDAVGTDVLEATRPRALGPRDSEVQKTTGTDTSRHHRGRVRKVRPRPFTPGAGRRAFRQHGGLIMRCFDEHGNAADDGVRVLIRSKIRSNGKVVEATIEPKARAETPLGKCLIGVAKRIRYPRHDQDLITFVQPLTVKRSKAH